MVERGSAFVQDGSIRIFQIGSGNERLGIVGSSSAVRYLGFHTVAGVNRFTAGTTPTVDMGQEIELRLVLSATSFLLGQSIDGGAESTATGTAGFGTDPWGVARLHIGNDGTTGHGPNPIISVKAVLGVYTMDEMRNIRAARLWRRVA
jgi:hypothetical protein